MNMKKHILLTNDDGIDSPGLFALHEELRKIGEVTVVAPHIERSAVGHAITIHNPIRVLDYNRPDKFHGYAIDGTPADCVKIAAAHIMRKKPDIVVSGVNHGPNTATNVLYSGTVSAATEGVILGIPAIASSLMSFDYRADMSYAAQFTARLAKMVLEQSLPADTLLNVNIPALPKSSITGVAITRLGKGRYEEYFEKRVDLSHRDYYWLTGKKMNLDTEEDVDDVAVARNKVSITPIHIDLTSYAMVERLKSWDLSV